MLQKLFGFLGRVREFKNNVTIVVEALDRLDDDLDGDGKSELENLKADATHLLAETSAWLKIEMDRIVGHAKLQYGEFQKIADRAKKLAAHVKGGK